MRDHTRLRAFELADQFVLAVYRNTQRFPREEQYGLTSQLRRAAISIASNIVEGCSRTTEKDYLRFIEIAFGSARESQYQLTVATRLSYLTPDAARELAEMSTSLCKTLNNLIRALQNPQPTAE